MYVIAFGARRKIIALPEGSNLLIICTTRNRARCDLNVICMRFSYRLSKIFREDPPYQDAREICYGNVTLR